ncbi:MAG: hypothetical protein AB1449_02190 [Chloroflexota bacterium]
MQRYIDAPKVRRYGKLGSVLSFGGLALMIAGIVLAFARREEFFLILATSFSGLTLTQLGTLLRNRWGRHPRMDELLDDALKGMDDRYAIFHYLLGAAHALFCSAGVFALCTSDVDGEISYQGGVWIRLRPKPGLLSRSRVQRLPDPAAQIRSDVARLRRTIARQLSLEGDLAVLPILVFVHPQAEVRAEGAPFPAVHIKKLKPYLRSLPKTRGLTPEQVSALVPARLR